MSRTASQVHVLQKKLLARDRGVVECCEVSHATADRSNIKAYLDFQTAQDYRPYALCLGMKAISLGT